MGQASRVLRTYGKGGYMFWCPGCEKPHGVNVTGDNGPKWSFNGDFDKPTFAPSILCFTAYSDDDDEKGEPKRLPDGQRRTLCHSFVRDGQIEFCGDSPHALAGKTVPLPDLPQWMRDEALKQ